MLRDKFIHYFQQWRERQLSRGEHWLAQHLAGRSPREKGMLLAAVVFLFSVGYYGPHLAAVERTDRTTGDNVAATGGDEHQTEERRAGYYGGAKIRHNNACAGIAGYQ